MEAQRHVDELCGGFHQKLSLQGQDSPVAATEGFDMSASEKTASSESGGASTGAGSNGETMPMSKGEDLEGMQAGRGVDAPGQSAAAAGGKLRTAESESKSRELEFPPAKSLEELAEQIEALIRHDASRLTELHLRKDIARVMENWVPDENDWKRYAFYDSDKRYTRNLIATDEESYSLMLLCWNPGKESPIHDHPCHGCWLKVVTGNIVETRYVKEDGGHKLKQISEFKAKTGDVAFMHDELGFHKVGNPSDSVPAATLHLYAPPYCKCKVWFDPDNADNFMEPTVTYYSEGGERVEYN